MGRRALKLGRKIAVPHAALLALAPELHAVGGVAFRAAGRVELPHAAESVFEFPAIDQLLEIGEIVPGVRRERLEFLLLRRLEEFRGRQKLERIVAGLVSPRAL